jgi:hypothetical protein
MTIAPIGKLMPELPQPGQKVRWRDPRNARASGWLDLFGPDPFEVVRIVHNSDPGLAAGLMVHTRLGERESPEVYLALADEHGKGNKPRRQVVS